MKVIKKYKTWYDSAARRLVTYSPYWTKEYKDSLVFIGELQPNQNPFKLDEVGIYRELYGKRKYYCLRDYESDAARNISFAKFLEVMNDDNN
jgi:hypothetical protein